MKKMTKAKGKARRYPVSRSVWDGRRSVWQMPIWVGTCPRQRPDLRLEIRLTDRHANTGTKAVVGENS